MLYCTQEKHYRFNARKQKREQLIYTSNCSSTSEVHATLTSLFPAHLYSDRSISLSHTQSQLKDVEKLLPASAAVTALGVAAVKTDSDFDSSMSQVAAVSGATGEDFDKLRAKAREIGAKTKFSAYEATIMNNLTGEVKLSGKPSKTGLPANHRG